MHRPWLKTAPPTEAEGDRAQLLLSLSPLPLTRQIFEAEGPLAQYSKTTGKRCKVPILIPIRLG